MSLKVMKLMAGKLKGGERREKAFYCEELDISCLVMVKNEKKKKVSMIITS